MVDPSSFLDRILSPIADNLGYDKSQFGGGGQPLEELIAEAIGNRLAHLLITDGPASADDKDLTNLNRHHDQLQSRNTALAAALGACDCWGEAPDCDICRGEGGPGTVLPDPRLFAVYVRPALRTLRAAAIAKSTIAAPADSQHENRSEDVPNMVI